MSSLWGNLIRWCMQQQQQQMQRDREILWIRDVTCRLWTQWMCIRHVIALWGRQFCLTFCVSCQMCDESRDDGIIENKNCVHSIYFAIWVCRLVDRLSPFQYHMLSFATVSRRTTNKQITKYTHIISWLICCCYAAYPANDNNNHWNNKKYERITIKRYIMCVWSVLSSTVHHFQLFEMNHNYLPCINLQMALLEYRKNSIIQPGMEIDGEATDKQQANKLQKTHKFEKILIFPYRSRSLACSVD